MIGSLVVLAMVGIDGTMSRTEGALLIAIYLICFVFLLTDTTGPKKTGGSELSLLAFKPWLYLLLGLGVVIASAEITVRSATHVADALIIEQSFIAIVVIGLGTSLPELSISVAAIMKKRSGLSVGNLIGRNIFDTFMPIGVAGAISGLDFDARMLRVDLPSLLALSGLVLIFFVKKKGLQKHEAAIVLVLYCGYVLVRISSA